MSILVSSFLASLVLIFLLEAAFRKLHWLDKPQVYGYQRSPVPYGMGVVFFLIFLPFGLYFLELSPQLIALFVSGALLTATCFLDDRVNLPTLPRLCVQILCAVILVGSGIGIPAISNPFGDPIVLDGIRWVFEIGATTFTIEPLADLVALLWIVFVINAINWLDGVPGIVSGVSAIACSVLFFLATMKDLHVIDQTTLSGMALILAGSTLAFLLFDFPKPRILMGDSGTMFLGMMIAVMAIFSGGKLATAFIVLAIPILDAIWTIVRRLLKGQSPFRGDFQHFHHELLKAGLSQRQVNLFYYVVSLGFGYSALYLQSMGKMIAIIVLFFLMASIRFGLARKSSRQNA